MPEPLELPPCLASWLDALDTYAYPVDFEWLRQHIPTVVSGMDPESTALIVDALQRWGLPQELLDGLKGGDFYSTLRFSEHFRSLAELDLKAYLEVAYWKYSFDPKLVRRKMVDFSIALSRSAKPHVGRTTDLPSSQAITEKLTAWKSGDPLSKSGVEKLARLFTKRGTELRANLSGEGLNIAGPCAVPAFLWPDDFPMVDTVVAGWTNQPDASTFNLPGAQLPRCGHDKFLTVADWCFWADWVKWCREAARELNALVDGLSVAVRENGLQTAYPSVGKVSGFRWNARHVEMAVFADGRSGRFRLMPIRPPNP